MMLEVGYVIESKIGQRHFRAPINGAWGGSFGRGDLPDYVGEVTVVGRPECKTDGRTGSCVVLDGDVGHLIVARPIQTRLGQGADEALMIVGSRIDEVAQEL